MTSLGVATGSHDPTPVPRKERVRTTWIFLAASYLALQAYLWFVVPARNHLWTATGAILILGVIVIDPIRRRETAASLGLGGRNFLAAWKLLVVPMIAALLVLVVVQALTPDAPRQGRFLRRILHLLPWALVQQSLLQATFNRRLQGAMGSGIGSSLVNGIFFAGMHLPGAVLTGLTFVAGSYWSWTYQKRPNLWAVVLSHVLLSAMAQSLLPSEWTHGFRVGPGYFRWR